MPLKDFTHGQMMFIYRDECLQMFFSPNREAQLKRVPPLQRQNVIAELANRLQALEGEYGDYPAILADMIVWDILREEGWALPKPSVRPSYPRTPDEDGATESFE